MRWFACIVLLALSAGCRAPAAPDAGFLQDPGALEPNVNEPFDESWFKAGVDLRSYRQVSIAPVDTAHLLKMDWWSKASLAQRPEAAEAQRLGGYFEEQLREAFRKTNGPQVVSTAGPGTLVIELSIVEVVPTKAWLNVIGYATIGALSHGVTAFEGRLRDGGTGEVLARFKDREYGQFAPISAADLTWYVHSRDTIRDWAEEIAEVCESAPGKRIDRASTITLRPW